MKKSILLFLIILSITSSSAAKEGMWIPALLGAVEDDMQALGLRLSAEDLYSVNEGSLKDAIVLFGGGCTAEIVSKDGLLFTNHHCGLGAIQSHSTLQHDYITDGFWATDYSSELPCKDVTAMFIVRMDDVTSRMLEGITTTMSVAEMERLKAANKKKIEEEYRTNNPLLGLQLKAFNYGNQYFAILTKTYTDVRLVGAPPSAIGKFGGDTDNWVWPRHTGDFSVFRIYANESNEPAPYAPNNIPFKPARHLRISLDGVHEGDFSMVYGFPGKTEHFLTSYAVDYVVNKSNPMKIRMRDISLDVLRGNMNDNDAVRIKYTAKQSGIANAWKKWKGQNIGLTNFNAIAQKQEFEKKFQKDVEEKKLTQYRDLLSQLESAQRALEPVNLAREAFIEYMFFGPEMFDFAHSFRSLVDNYDSLKAGNKLDAAIVETKNQVRGFYKDLDLATEREIYNGLTVVMREYMSAYELSPYLDFIPADADKKDPYATSIFSDSTALIKLLDNFGKKGIAKIRSDFFYIHANEMYDSFDQKIRPEFVKKNTQVEALMQQYVKATMEVYPGDTYWSDANSTLRISYGKVEGSAPHDGMMYTYYTTSNGVLAKYDPMDPDFILPPRLVELFRKGDFGVYGENNELRVCYTGSNHTTGGNSGSPALNANGELTGINFDRSWESTMSDIMYNPEICRNIMVDIRYVLWVIDVYANADWLLKEMTLIKTSPERPEVN